MLLLSSPAAAGKLLPEGLLDIRTRRITWSTKEAGIPKDPGLLGRRGYFRMSLAAFLAFAAPLPEPPGLLPFFPPVVLLPPVALPFTALFAAPSTFLPMPAIFCTVPFPPRSRYFCFYPGGAKRQTRTRFRVAIRGVLDEPRAVLLKVESAASVTHGVAVRLDHDRSTSGAPARFSGAAARETGAAVRKRIVPMYLTGVLRGV